MVSITPIPTVFNSDGSVYHDILLLDTENSLECPFCFLKIETQPLAGVLWNGKKLQVFLKCKTCKNSFIGYTDFYDNRFHIEKLSKGNHKKKNFEQIILEISPSFVTIYQEAEIAEQTGLMQICGVGYRKAIEYLIKDYLIRKFPSKEGEIKESYLGKCIEDHINNVKIKEISKRAAWLGNDETHYTRKWEDKDLIDLKKLIDITVHYILMEVESENYMRDMASKK